MSSTPLFRTLTADDMQAVDQVIRTRLHSDVVLIRQVAEYIISAGGKRLRPVLTLMAGRAMGYGEPYLHELAAMVEGAVWHPASRSPGGSEGDVIITLLTDCLSELGAYLAELGEGIEVISPPELRRRLEALRRRPAASPGLTMVRHSPSAGDNT